MSSAFIVASVVSFRVHSLTPGGEREKVFWKSSSKETQMTDQHLVLSSTNYGTHNAVLCSSLNSSYRVFHYASKSGHWVKIGARFPPSEAGIRKQISDSLLSRAGLEHPGKGWIVRDTTTWLTGSSTPAGTGCTDLQLISSSVAAAKH